MKQYQAEFSLNRKQRSLVLHHLCPVHKVLTDFWYYICWAHEETTIINYWQLGYTLQVPECVDHQQYYCYDEIVHCSWYYYKNYKTQVNHFGCDNVSLLWLKGYFMLKISPLTDFRVHDCTWNLFALVVVEEQEVVINWKIKLVSQRRLLHMSVLVEATGKYYTYNLCSICG